MTAPDPMTPAGCDLRDFPHTPLFRSRLFGSTFHSRASDSEWRAGVTLWLKSWDQVPAGSLPADDIDLCRLAELARDLKTWKKLKDGALRGWVLCSDGRLYHPVVAEGVVNAIEHKKKQRLKTAKARIAALEKHLKDATTPDDAARITEEIARIKQTMPQGLSQTQSQTLQQGPREGKGEGRGKEKGLDSSAPNGAGGPPPAPPADAPPPKPPKTPEEMAKAELWRAAVSVLEAGGCPPSQCRTFMGKLVQDYTFEIVQAAVAAAVTAQPAEAREYLKATCQRLKGERAKPGQMTDEQRDAANAAASAEAMDIIRRAGQPAPPAQPALGAPDA